MAIQPISNGDQVGPSTSLYRPTHTLQAHSRAVTALRYSGDGRTLVSGGADGWVHFWYIPHAGRYWQTADSVGTVFPTNISEASKHIHKVSRSWRRKFGSRNADCIRYQRLDNLTRLAVHSHRLRLSRRASSSAQTHSRNSKHRLIINTYATAGIRRSHSPNFVDGILAHIQHASIRVDG